MTLHSIIIGAGISGLVAAHHLKKSGRDVRLIESSDRAGGLIQTLEADGFLLERGPNSLRGTHEFLELVEELNLSDELVTGDPKAPAYVYWNDVLHAVPMNPPALIKTKLLSPAAKLRLLREPFVTMRRDANEESLASFVRRRLGPEILERLVAPFVSGVYAGDPEKLSVQAVFARLAEFETEGGSIVRGALRAARKAKKQSNKSAAPKRSLRPYRLCSFRRGLQTLTDALAKSLGESLLTETRVEKISYRQQPDNASRFQLTVNHQGQQQTLEAATLMIAAPADAAAQMLSECAPDIAALLSDIHYTSLVAVPLAYRREQLKRPLDGFGFLAPRPAGLRTLGSIWVSSLFAGRSPADRVLLHNFIGGETDPEAIGLSDRELIRTVHGELQKVIGIEGEPEPLPLLRWPRAIPQYNLGHAARVAGIEAALKNYTGMRLIGNYLHGVSLGDCIRQAGEIAEAVQQT